ncbi:MAG: DUF333 domain-containing protein [Candidatus Micrarchaeia archaeon]
MKLQAYSLLLIACMLALGCTTPENPSTGTNASSASNVEDPYKYCADNGGRITIVQEGSGEHAVCEFPNGAKCEAVAYSRSECTHERPNYCAADSDCGCGTHIITGECFVGSRPFVNVEKQCPDYCTGISAMFETKCVNHQCKIVKKEQTRTQGQAAANVGAECSSISDCPKGADCYRLPGYAKPRCYPGDPCELCPPEKECTVSTSFPAIVACRDKESAPVEGFCGWSTEGACKSDSDCTRGGCNSQICQAKSEGIIMSSCDKPCYKPEPYGLKCKCVSNKCVWTK